MLYQVALGYFGSKGWAQSRREMLLSCIYLRTHVCIINMKTKLLIVSLSLRVEHVVFLKSGNRTGSSTSRIEA